MPHDSDSKPIERRVLWEGSVGSFGIDDVELPTQRRARLALLRHPGAAAVVPFPDDTHVLLLRQYRYAAAGTIWEVPAGKLAPGEDPAVCAARELEEETGYRARRIESTGVILTTPGFSDERIHLFCAYELEPGRMAHEPGEVIEEVRELRLGDALKMIDSGEIIDAKSIVALYHASRRAGIT